jgi:hypothetical protein
MEYCKIVSVYITNDNPVAHTEVCRVVEGEFTQQ